MDSTFERMQRGFGGNAKPEKSFVSMLVSNGGRLKEAAHRPSANFVPSDITKLGEGMRVEQQKFGFGHVVKMEGSAHNPVETIKFDQNGEKKIMLNYAKLMIVS